MCVIYVVYIFFSLLYLVYIYTPYNVLVEHSVGSNTNKA